MVGLSLISLVLSPVGYAKGLFDIFASGDQQSKILTATHRVDHLAYGESLFQTYTQNPFAGLIPLEIAVERGLIPRELEANDTNLYPLLFRNELLYQYGLFESSADFFKSLQARGLGQSKLNQSVFRMGELYYDNNDFVKSEASFKQITGDFSQQQRLHYLLADAQLRQNKSPDSILSLTPFYQSLIQYRQLLSETTCDPLQWQALLQSMGAVPEQSNPLLPDLMDRIVLSATVQCAEFGPSGNFAARLAQVQPASPWFADAQLLLMSKGVERHTIETTLELSELQQNVLTMLQSRSSAHTQNQPLQVQWQAASDISDDFAHTLSTRQDRVDRAKFNQWFAEHRQWLVADHFDSQFSASTPIADKKTWLAWWNDSVTQRLFNTYQNALSLEQSLASWSDKIPFLDSQLAQHQQVFDQRLKGVETQQLTQTFARAKSTAKQLEARLAQAATLDINGELLTQQQRRQLQMIRISKVRLAKLTQAGLITGSKSQQHQLTLDRALGVLQWQSGLNQPQAVYEAKKTLQQTLTGLSTAQDRLVKLETMASQWHGQQQRTKLNALQQQLGQLVDKVQRHKANALTALEKHAYEYDQQLTQQHLVLYNSALQTKIALGLQVYEQQPELQLGQSLIDDLEYLLGSVQSTQRATQRATQRPTPTLLIANSVLALSTLYFDAAEQQELTLANKAYATAIDYATDWLQLNANLHQPQPTDQVHYRLAQMHAVLTEQEQSLAYLTKLYNSQSEFFAEAAFRLGEAAYAKGDYDQAIGYYSAQLEQQPTPALDSKSRYMLGWAYFKDIQSDKALHQFLTLLIDQRPADTGDQQPTYSKAIISLQQDVTRVAKIAIEHNGGAFGLTAAYPAPLSQQGRLGFELLLADLQAKNLYYKWYQAAEVFQKAYPDDLSSPVLAQQTVILLQQQQFLAKAREQKALFLTRYTHRDEVQTIRGDYALDLGDYYRAQGQFEKALPYYQIALANLSEKQVDIQERLADSYFDLQDYMNSSLWYQTIAYPSPTLTPKTESNRLLSAAQAHLVSLDNLAKLSSQGQTQTQQALQQLQLGRLQFLHAFGDDPAAKKMLLKVRLAAAQFTFDQQYYRQTLVLMQPLLIGLTTPKTSQGTDVKASSFTLEQQVQIIDLVSSAQFNQKEYAKSSAAFALGLAVVEQTGNGAAAQKINKKYQPKWASSFGDSQFLLAEQAIAQAQIAAAITALQTLVATVPKHKLAAAALFDQGVYLAQLQDMSAAVQAWTQLVNSDSNSELVPKAYLKIADAHQQSKDYAQAAQALSQYRILVPSAVPAELAVSFAIADLYEKNGDVDLAVHEYKNIANDGATQQADWFTAVSKLIVLYQSQQPAKADFWRQKTLDRFGRKIQTLAGDEQKLVLQSAAHFADQANTTFKRITLKAPLQQSLARKQKALLASVERYQTLVDWHITPYYEQGLQGLGSIYIEFAKALMASERPANLSEMALEEYDILLEEQAYPFEEKGLLLHEANLKRLWDGEQNTATLESLAVLQKLMSAQYARPEQVEPMYDQPN